MEATNDNRAGILRFNLQNFSFDQNKFYLIVMAFDLDYNESSVQITSPNTITLSNPVHRWYQATGQPAGFSGHHYLQFSTQATSFGIIRAYDQVQPGATDGISDATGIVAAYLEFDATSVAEDMIVSVAVGSSFVSPEKAHANMLAELSPPPSPSSSSSSSLSSSSSSLYDVEAVVTRVTAVWENVLSAVDVYDDSEVGSVRIFPLVLWCDVVRYCIILVV